ncbi:deaminated glutathione amidase [Nilaparvata lugens]|uniref:deaminated glutathione amidase n=1 Tax=Nilaparvata lugens TaxID=108931 RepID=UPI00193E5AD6|nr:deaminated glutathione amidase [Nilaparvata lugens]
MNVLKPFTFFICTRKLKTIGRLTAKRYCTRELINSCEVPSNNIQFRNMNQTASVAVCQFTAKNDKEQNFKVCKYLIEKASKDGAKMIFLPEACDYIGESKEEVSNLSEPLDGPLMCRYKELAKTAKVWLSLGGIHEKVLERYQCYDMRFPEMSLALTRLGAEVLTYPSAFTFATGAVHWEVLLRSRAIENQCYVIAAAQYGAHNKKRTSWGHAMVIDPSGNVVAQCSEGTGYVLANIDLSLIEDIRKSMPTDKQKRHDIYPQVLPLSPPPHNTTPSTTTPHQQHYQFGQVSVPDSLVFYKTDTTMAFVNKRCVVPGHVLVAPIRAALRLEDLTPSEVSDLFLVVQRVEQVMEQVHGSSSTTIALQDGPDAGRTIHHLHVHIMPRKEKDFLNNDEIYYELQKHDKDESKPWRGMEEMCSEASLLRERFL